MKLREFILLVAFLVSATVVGIFTIKTESVLSEGFSNLSEIHRENIRNVINSMLEEKKNYLKNFGNLLRSDGELASSYALSQESGDFLLTKEILNKIKTESGFDIVDILSLTGNPISEKELSIKNIPVDDVLKHRNQVHALEVDGQILLLTFAPLTVFDAPVGYLVLGFKLNSSSTSEITRITNAKITFYFPGNKPKNLVSAEGNDTGILGFDHRPLLIATLVESSFIDVASLLIRKNIIWFSIFVFGILAALIYLVLDLGFVRKFKFLLATIDKSAQDLNEGILPAEISISHPILEVKNLASSFDKFGKSVVAYDSKIQEQAKIAAEIKTQAEITNLAQQTAHDIRAPLEFLDVAVSELEISKEDDRIQIRSAIRTIRDIANGLLNQGVPQEVPNKPYAAQTLLDFLISEKRTLFRTKPGLELRMRTNPSAYGLFAKINPTEFKRVFSNLINNSVEAIFDKGTVEIEIGEKNQAIAIRVIDNGIGISKDRLPDLMTKRRSVGKSNGHGWGLFGARSTVESWGGTIAIESTEGKGTEVEVIIPKSPSPPWFVSELLALNNATVAILDDDASVHQIWKLRFGKVMQSQVDQAFVVEHFSNRVDFSNWVKKRDPLATTLYLVDFEILKDSYSGLDIIQELGIASKSILVTSRHEEEAILSRCSEMGIGLIPKSIAGIIPIRIVEREIKFPDGILIDNDPHVDLLWRTRAKICKKQLVTFRRVNEFFYQEANYCRETPVYIDSRLGENSRGEVIARDIQRLGFKTIILTTALNPDAFADLSWLSATMGKAPPW